MRRAILMIVALMVVCSFSVFGTGNAEQRSQEKVTLVFVPKLVGIPWFNAMENGFKDYAQEVGDLEISVVGAPDTDPAAQARILEDVIAQQPDAIVVVPNYTQVLEPIMARGREAGILMVAQEAPSIENADLDIEFLIAERYGRDAMELFVREAGSTGGYAIMVGGLTVESHNQRADMAVLHQEANYPDLYQVTAGLKGQRVWNRCKIEV